jgi:predicted aminopeptidase
MQPLMKTGVKSKRRFRKWRIALVLLLLAVGLSGCDTFRFYRQAIKGQYQMIVHQQNAEKLAADPRTPARLKEKLQLIGKLRAFADQNLKLPVDGHYLKYVDVHRPFVVWNVEAAPEFSMEPKGWWYPLVGRLEYRGYFSEKTARDYGTKLGAKGFDVYIGGVEAYSTLGWFKDPILNTFVFNPEPDLAETLFHELGHQRVFARGDTDFNEAFATTVGQEGARRWLQAHADPQARTNYDHALKHTREFAALIMQTRLRLEALFGDERDENGKVKASRKPKPASPDELRRQKDALIERLRAEYAELKAAWDGQSQYDEWFAREINNAKLNSVAAYYDLVPGFEHLLALHGGDLEKFYDAAQRLADKPKKERHEWLRTLGHLEAPAATAESESVINSKNRKPKAE